MSRLIVVLEKAGKPFWITAGLILLCLVAFLDYQTGYEISFSLFYLIPIALFSWFVGTSYGVLIAFLSAALWLFVDVLAGVQYSKQIIYFWNTLIRLAFFNLIVLLISFGKALERE